MKIEAFKIEGEIYLPLHMGGNKTIEIVFYLPIEHIYSLQVKSKFFPMEISKETFIKSTNAGTKTCKRITIKNKPCFIQMFFDRVGFDFSEKSQYTDRVLWQPSNIGTLTKKPKFKRIDFHNAFFNIRKNIKSGVFEKSLFLSKSHEKGLKRKYNGAFTQNAY